MPRVSDLSTIADPGLPTSITIPNEATARAERVIVSQTRHGYHLHVEDGLAIATTPSAANALMTTTADAMDKAGFLVEESARCEDVEKCPGYDFGPRRRACCVPQGEMS